MNKLLRKKLTRGGFTLAELLIVVAIIAILVAIAMPIFVNGLNDAKYRVVQSDARNIRAAAVEEILTHWNENANNGVKYAKGAETADAGWEVYARVDTAGHIKSIDINVKDGSSGNTVTAEQSFVCVTTETQVLSSITSWTDVKNRSQVLDLGSLSSEKDFYGFKLTLKSLSSPESHT